MPSSIRPSNSDSELPPASKRARCVSGGKPWLGLEAAAKGLDLVVVPRRLTAEQRRLLEEFELGSGEDTYEPGEGFEFESLEKGRVRRDAAGQAEVEEVLRLDDRLFCHAGGLVRPLALRAHGRRERRRWWRGVPASPRV